MKGFRADRWSVTSLRGGEWKMFTHKDFPFIKLDFIKVQKGYDRRGPIWNITLHKWNTALSYTSLYHGRLTKNIIEKEFEKMMNNKDAKTIIMQYLFNGKWTGRN